MTSRKDVAELAAMLAARDPKQSPGYVASVALKLARIGAAAATNATTLCNVPDFQARYDRKKASLMKSAGAAIGGDFRIYAKIGGDPRGCCLHLLSTDHKDPVRGNTFGGEESGWGI